MCHSCCDLWLSFQKLCLELSTQQGFTIPMVLAQNQPGVSTLKSQ